MVVAWFPLRLYEKEFWCWIVIYWHRQSYDTIIYKYKYLFDFSNFSKDSKFYDSQNKMVVGKMNVECKEFQLTNLLD